MVSLRCKMIVKTELENLGLHYIDIDFGNVEILENINDTQRQTLHKNLMTNGLMLLSQEKSDLIDTIKSIILKMIHYAENDEVSKLNFSNYLEQTLGHPYAYLSTVFAEVKGITIEQYIILNKVERVKELIIYNELSFLEIANKLYYKNISHLTGQFKRITGLSPSYFKKLAQQRKRILTGDH